MPPGSRLLVLEECRDTWRADTGRNTRGDQVLRPAYRREVCSPLPEGHIHNVELEDTY